MQTLTKRSRHNYTDEARRIRGGKERSMTRGRGDTPPSGVGVSTAILGEAAKSSGEWYNLWHHIHCGVLWKKKKCSRSGNTEQGRHRTPGAGTGGMQGESKVHLRGPQGKRCHQETKLQEEQEGERRHKRTQDRGILLLHPEFKAEYKSVQGRSGVRDGIKKNIQSESPEDGRMP